MGLGKGNLFTKCASDVHEIAKKCIKVTAHWAHEIRFFF